MHVPAQTWPGDFEAFSHLLCFFIPSDPPGLAFFYLFAFSNYRAEDFAMLSGNRGMRWLSELLLISLLF